MPHEAADPVTAHGAAATAGQPPGPTARDAPPGYASLLRQGRSLYPGIRIGRPGRSRGYWPMITALRMLRVRYAVQMSGAEHVGDGPAIIVGNHVSLIDPPIAVASNWWRVIAFTKVEAFESPGGAFFRIMGQIPLRRGDEQCTRWAMAMAQQVLADGAKIGIYPEGTRSPDGRLHRLHKRVLVPLLQANPDVPVHVVVTRYKPRARRRTRVSIQFSPRLDVDPRSMSAEQLTEAVRDALVGTGDLEYVDEYARDVKARAAAARAARPGNART